MGLEDILQEAEQHEQWITAQSQLQKNLHYFQQASPDIYQAFHGYEPSRFKLHYHPRRNQSAGYWDIVETASQGLLYKQDSRTLARAQVADFTKQPYSIRINTRPVYDLDTDKDIHTGNIVQITEAIYATADKHPSNRVTLEADTPLLIVNGIGLGYHIAELIGATCIHHLCLVEPDPDMFYLSLHTIDWQVLCEHFDQPGRTINITLGQPPQDAAQMLLTHIENIGFFNAIRTLVFKHVNTQPLADTTEQLIYNLSAKVNGLGYFDDERVGLAHTLANVKNQTPILDFSQPKPTGKTPPVFVIANGPSLDQAQAFLADNHDKAIIISCGTALGSLAAMGIKPDLHVEMERTRPVVEWIQDATDPEFRAGVPIIGLNTVHPDTLHCFEQHYLALKPNDLGYLYLAEFFDNHLAKAGLVRCNPTVGNMGIATAIALGFQHVYLFGLDLGFAADGQHHSKHSVHYRIKEEEQESLNLKSAEGEDNMRLPGNFGGEVIATPIFAAARQNVQKLLQENPKVRCFNTSQGLLIEGAKPTELGSIKLQKHNLQKDAWLQRRLQAMCYPKKLELPQDEKLLAHFQPVELLCEQLQEVFAQEANSIADAWQQLQTAQQHYLVWMEQVKLSSRWLIKGSVYSFMLSLARSLYACNKEAVNLKLYNSSLSHFQNFLATASQLYQQPEAFMVLDNRRRDIKSKLKGSE